MLGRTSVFSVRKDIVEKWLLIEGRWNTGRGDDQGIGLAVW